MSKAKLKITSRWNKDGSAGVAKLEYKNTPAEIVATEGMGFIWPMMKTPKRIRDVACRQAIARLLRSVAKKIESDK